MRCMDVGRKLQGTRVRASAGQGTSQGSQGSQGSQAPRAVRAVQRTLGTAVALSLD